MCVHSQANVTALFFAGNNQNLVGRVKLPARTSTLAAALKNWNHQISGAGIFFLHNVTALEVSTIWETVVSLSFLCVLRPELKTELFLPYTDFRVLFFDNANDYKSTFASEFKKQFPDLPIKVSSRSNQVLVRNCVADCMLAKLFASNDLRVQWIEKIEKMRVLNKYIRGIGQSGIPFEEPLSEMGLTGKDEIIGVSDTGIDHDHCFFRDDNNPLPFRTLNLNHRKIVRYDALDGSAESQEDLPEGHGTHVAGSLCGSTSSNNEINKYHGIVPEAKIAFFDLAKGGNTVDSISLPDDLTSDMFPNAYSAGARIHTNSWGGDKASYSSFSRDVDVYMDKNRDFLVIFAAGNDADAQCKDIPLQTQCDKFSVMAPSTNKNGLSVGSSQAPLPSWEDMGEGNYDLWAYTADKAIDVKYRLAKGSFGPRFPLSVLTSEYSIVDGNPVEGCDPLTRVGPQTIVLVTRGTCVFVQKLLNVQQASAIAGIVVNSNAGDPIIMGSEGDTGITIPNFMVGMENGAALRNLLKTHGDLRVKIVSNSNFDPHKQVENLSDFSSRGPTSDHRFKPDVVAVGEYVFSAKSDANPTTKNCDLFEQMGTSMAAPSIAGAAVIIRQYYLKSYYDNVKIYPNGDLLKATLIQAAVPLKGLVDRNAQGDWINLPHETPNYYEGHGTIRLNTTLRTSTSSTLQMTIDQTAKIGNTGDSLEYCVSFKSSAQQRNFRATLAWTDPPGTVGMKIQLVNDLNLIVTTPNGQVIFGNTGNIPDILNNLEKVTVENAASGNYHIVVQGGSVAHGPQQYAVVISGTHVPQTQCADVCASKCSNKGTCFKGLCSCLPGWFGASCDQEIQRLFEGDAPQNGSVQVARMNMYMFELPQITDRPNLESIQFHVKRVDADNSDPDVFVRQRIYPTIKDDGYDFHDSTCNNCGSSLGTADVHIQLDYRIGSVAYGPFYIGVYAACCVDSKYQIWVTVQESGRANIPTVNSMEPQVITQNGLITIHGENLRPLLSLNWTRIMISTQPSSTECIYNYILSSANRIICQLRMSNTVFDGMYEVKVAISGTVLTNRIPVSVNITSFETPSSAFEIQGMRNRTCENPSSSDCIFTHSFLSFSYNVAHHGGGDVFLVGPNVGKRALLENREGLITYGSLPCQIQLKTTFGNQIHCKTSPHSIFDKGQPIKISGEEIKKDSAQLFFASLPTVQLLQRGDNLFRSIDGSSQRVHVTYREGVEGGALMEIHGTSLQCDTCNAFSDTVSQLPVLAVDHCSSIVSASDRLVICRTDKATADLFGSAQNLVVTVQGFNIPDSDKFSMYFAPLPKFFGVTKSNPNSMVVSLTLIAANPTRFCFVGENFDVSLQATVVIFTSPPVMVAPELTQDDLICVSVNRNVLPKINGYVLHFGIQYENITYLNDTVSVIINNPPRITSVSADNQFTVQSGVVMLDPASTVIYLHGTDLPEDRWGIRVVYGDYGCPVIALTKTYLSCRLDPRSEGQNLRIKIQFDVDSDVMDTTFSLTFQPSQTRKPDEFIFRPTIFVMEVEMVASYVDPSKNAVVAFIQDGGCAMPQLITGMTLIKSSGTNFTIPKLDIDVTDESIITVCASMGRIQGVENVTGPFSDQQEIQMRHFFPVLPFSHKLIIIRSIDVQLAQSSVSATLKKPFNNTRIPAGKSFVAKVSGRNLDSSNSLSLVNKINSFVSIPASPPIQPGSNTFHIDLPKNWTTESIVLQLIINRTEGIVNVPLGTLSTVWCQQNVDCGGHGKCSESGECRCDEPYFGMDCTQRCPSNSISNECSSHGHCVRETGKCSCEAGYFSSSCYKQSTTCDLSTAASGTYVKQLNSDVAESAWELYEIKGSNVIHVLLVSTACALDVYGWETNDAIGHPQLASWRIVGSGQSHSTLFRIEKISTTAFMGVFSACETDQKIAVWLGKAEPQPNVKTNLYSLLAGSEINSPPPSSSTIHGMSIFYGVVLGVLVVLGIGGGVCGKKVWKGRNQNSYRVVQNARNDSLPPQEEMHVVDE